MITLASIIHRFSGKRNRHEVKPTPRRICAQGVIFLEPARLARRRSRRARTGESIAAATAPVSAITASAEFRSVVGHHNARSGLGFNGGMIYGPDSSTLDRIS